MNQLFITAVAMIVAISIIAAYAAVSIRSSEVVSRARVIAVSVVVIIVAAWAGWVMQYVMEAANKEQVLLVAEIDKRVSAVEDFCDKHVQANYGACHTNVWSVAVDQQTAAMLITGEENVAIGVLIALAVQGVVIALCWKGRRFDLNPVRDDENKPINGLNAYVVKEDSLI